MPNKRVTPDVARRRAATPRAAPPERPARPAPRRKETAPHGPAARSGDATGRLRRTPRAHPIELETQAEALRRARAELEVLRAQYRDLYDRAPVGYFTLTKHGAILEANLTAARLLDVAQSALVRQRLTRFILPEDRPIYQRHRQRLFQTGAPQVCEMRMLRAGRDPFWARLEAAATQDAQRARAFRAVLNDITEHKHAEQALRESAQRYREVFENESDAIMVIDAETLRFEDANVATLRLYGFTREEFLSLTAEDIGAAPEPPPSSVARGTTGDAASGRLPSRFHRKKDGTVLPVEISAGVFDAGGRRKIVAAVRDITERHRAEDQLRADRERLRALASQLSSAEERERRRLAATLHEQVGQLLALSRVKLAALREEAGGTGMAGQCDAVMAMIAEALATTRSLTSELAPPVLYRFGLEAAFEWYGERLREQTGLALQCVRRGRRRPLGDDLQGFLFAAARELLHNVVKHAGTGDARVVLDWRGEALVLSVEDDGVGFEPDADRGAPEDRGGFGLFSIRERARDLGGRLEVDSAPGAGTRVRLVMPTGAAGPGRTAP